MARGVYVGAPKTSVPLSEMSVGETVKININGSPTDFIIIQHGSPSTLYDSSCNGTWLMMKDVYTTQIPDSTNNDYANSDIHSYLNGTFLKLFDADMQSIIKQVKIPYHKGTGEYGSISSGVNGLSTKVFLLSGYECGWVTGGDLIYLPVDGAKLDYFTSGTDTDANNLRIAHQNNTASSWWLRSPQKNSINYTWEVTVQGKINATGTTGTSGGVRPAFILPSTTHVFDGMITDGVGKIEDNVARKVNQMYVGVDNLARRVKKAYIGIGGVARPFFSSGYESFMRYGTKTLSLGRMLVAATSVGDYALFAGGQYESSKKTVDAFNSSLTRKIPTALAVDTSRMGAASLGNYAIFSSGGTSYVPAIYDASLTRTNGEALSSSTIAMGGSITNKYALFAGYSSSTGNSSTYKVVDVFDANLTKSTVNLSYSIGLYAPSVASGDEYCLIGWNTSVNAFNSSLTRKALSTGTLDTREGSAIYIGDYAVFFAGGHDTQSSKVIGFDKSMTRMNLPDMTSARSWHLSLSLKGVGIVGGGRNATTYITDTDIYDTSLTKTIGEPFNTARYWFAGAVVGEYALFGGGGGIDVDYLNSVEVYKAV